MPGRSWRIARIAGIPIGVSPWWLAFMGLMTWLLGASWFPDRVAGIAPPEAYALGLACALLLGASILLHELGHAVVARRRGLEVAEIDLWLLGGVARMQGEPRAPGDELRFAIAGPAVTAAILALFAALDALLPVPGAIGALLAYQVVINALLLGFNLIPAFPLDGGRVARALMWQRSGDLAKATHRAAQLGRAFGWLLVGLGTLELAVGAADGMWMWLVAVFIILAARGEESAAEIHALLTGTPARSLMSSPVVAIPAWLSVEDALGRYFARYRYTAFPVVDAAGHVIGLVMLQDAEGVPRAQRSRVRAEQIADRDRALTVGEDADVAALLERPAFARVGRATVTDSSGAPLGLVSITDVQRAVRAAGPPSRRRAA
jgi:Zn-dependent protease